MKLEDIRSSELRSVEFNDLDFSDIRSSLGDFNRKSELDTREINIKDLYELKRHTRQIIKSVESGEGYNGVLRFAGVTFNLQIFGMEISQKEKSAKYYMGSTENLQQKVEELQRTIVDLRKKLTFPDKILSKFCEDIEKNMLETYQEKTDEMPEPAVFCSPCFTPGKSWALMEFDYKVLRRQHQKCEIISSNLQWQSIEVQLLRSELQKKLQIVTEKELHLISKHQELNKSQKDYEEKNSRFEKERAGIEREVERVDKYKRRIEKMKRVLKSQIEGFGSLNRPSSASRASDTSPSLRRFRSNSSMNEPLEAEIEELQHEIKSLETSLQESVNDTESVNLSHLYTKLSNLKTQKAIEKNAFNSDSVQVILTKPMERLPIPRRFTFSSPENSPNSTPTKMPTSSPRENSSEISKPPIYRKNIRGQTDSVSTLSTTRVMNIKEERLVERETELLRREKELQQTWMNLPDGQKLIPIVQKQIIDLQKTQAEYDKKIKLLQNQIIKYDSLEEKIKDEGKASESPDVNLNKVKDLYKLMEELLL